MLVVGAPTALHEAGQCSDLLVTATIQLEQRGDGRLIAHVRRQVSEQILERTPESIGITEGRMIAGIE